MNYIEKNREKNKASVQEHNNPIIIDIIRKIIRKIITPASLAQHPAEPENWEINPQATQEECVQAAHALVKLISLRDQGNLSPAIPGAVTVGLEDNFEFLFALAKRLTSVDINPDANNLYKKIINLSVRAMINQPESTKRPVKIFQPLLTKTDAKTISDIKKQLKKTLGQGTFRLNPKHAKAMLNDLKKVQTTEELYVFCEKWHDIIQAKSLTGNKRILGINVRSQTTKNIYSKIQKTATAFLNKHAQTTEPDPNRDPAPSAPPLETGSNK